jgi:hypothetical protein
MMSLMASFNKLAGNAKALAGVIVGTLMNNPAQAKGMFMNALKAGGNALGAMLEKIAGATIHAPTMLKPVMAEVPQGPNTAPRR